MIYLQMIWGTAQARFKMTEHVFTLQNRRQNEIPTAEKKCRSWRTNGIMWLRYIFMSDIMQTPWQLLIASLSWLATIILCVYRVYWVEKWALRAFRRNTKKNVRFMWVLIGALTLWRVRISVIPHRTLILSTALALYGCRDWAKTVLYYLTATLASSLRTSLHRLHYKKRTKNAKSIPKGDSLYARGTLYLLD